MKKYIFHICYWLYTAFYVYFFRVVVNSLARFTYSSVSKTVYGDFDQISHNIFNGDMVNTISREGVFLGILTVGLIIYSIYYWTPMFFRRKK